MIDRLEAERLANAIHSLRPDWPVRSLLGFLKQREARPLLELTVELSWVAQLPDTQTPARIDADGPWKRAVTGSVGRSAPKYRYAAPDDCGECNGAKDGPHVGHSYRPPTPPDERTGPTEAVRAALNTKNATEEVA